VTYYLAGFGRFLRGLKVGGYGLRLEPFQRTIFADHFGPAVEEVVIIPKKNYKTTSLAALALYHLSAVEDAEVPIVAAASK
jgi:phage terminase large subunit-like protein